MLLSEAKKGEDYTIIKVNLVGEAKRRAEELGILKGEKITLKRRYFSGGGIFVVGGVSVGLGKCAIDAVEVEK